MVTTPLKQLIKAQLKARRMRRLHTSINAKPKTFYQAMVAQDPSKALSPAQRKRIHEYSKDVFGSRRFAPWLELYSAYRGEFIEGWIPENYYMRVLLPTWDRHKNIDAKTITRRILGTDLVPDLAYSINGFWLDRDNCPLAASKLKEYLFADAEAVFVKADRGARGEAVWKIARDEFDLEHVSRLGDLVVQSPVEQHPFFDQFTTDSVATLRLLTLKAPGQAAKRVASILRFGQGGSTIITGNSIRVPVVDDRGTLNARAVDASWVSHLVHPDSQVAFAGKQIPGFQTAVAMCEKLHDESPFSAVVGWDIGFDRRSDPVLMEWNEGAASIAFSEASQGPCFKGFGWENAWRRR